MVPAVSDYGDKYAAMAPWRKAASIGLLVLGIVVLVLAVTGVLHAATIVLAAVVVILSLLVGPRSPLFKA